MTMLLNWLKWTQLTVAVAVAIAVSVMLPTVQGMLGLTLAALFVFWAARAIRDHKVSACLAFITSIAVAAILGSVLFPAVHSLLQGFPINTIGLLLWLGLFVATLAVILMNVVAWRWLISPGSQN